MIDKEQLRNDKIAALKIKFKISKFMKRVKHSNGETPIIEERMEEVELDSVEEVILDSSADESEVLFKEGSLSPENNSGVDDSFHYKERMSEDIDVRDDSEEETKVRFMRNFTYGIDYRKLDCNSILVCIEPMKKLHFSGKALVQVLKGTVEINGFKFGADGNKYSVFSAKGHSSLLSITALSLDESHPRRTNTVTGHSNISVEEFETSPGVLVVMEGFENEWCEGLRHLYPQASNLIGPSITGMGPGKTPSSSILIDKVGFQFIKSTKNTKIIDFPSYFDGVFDDLINKYDCTNGRICPFGGQGVGKSTFLRWLTNRLLSCQKVDKVLFLDLDPGQSEFSPPGMLSAHLCTDPILGPNFTHMQHPIRAVYLGGVNVADVPISYIRGVIELVEFCSEQTMYEGIPWVINTMGFSQGLGVHIACEIIKIVRPKSVIQIQIENDGRSFPFFLNKDNVTGHRTFLSSNVPAKYKNPLEDYAFLNVRSACNREDGFNKSGWGIDRKIARKLLLISYFAEKVGNAEGFTLQSVIPLRVPLTSVAIGTFNSNLSYDEVIATLNGNLVALCAMPESTFRSTNENLKLITKAGDHPNQCFGYGLVRAYDKSSQTLFIITPLQDVEVLEQVNVILAAGAIGIPINFYVTTGQSSKNTEIPYVISRKEGTSTLHAATKKFFVPKRVTHSVLKNCLL